MPFIQTARPRKSQESTTGMPSAVNQAAASRIVGSALNGDEE
jgi:hypothetical protein